MEVEREHHSSYDDPAQDAPVLLLEAAISAMDCGSVWREALLNETTQRLASTKAARRVDGQKVELA